MLLLLGMLLATEPPPDALFPLSSTKELHVHPTLFTVKGRPLAEAFGLLSGGWYPGLRLKLSADFTGYVVFSAASEVQLIVFDHKRKQVTDTRPLARYERLEGAYEKTTNSWLLALDGDGTWELVTSTFLVDFEKDVPEAKNITGQASSVFAFKNGKFEFFSNALPQKRAFPIKK